MTSTCFQPKSFICLYSSIYFDLMLYYQIETRARFAMLAYVNNTSTVINANCRNKRSNDQCDTSLESQLNLELNWTLANYSYL